MAQHHRADRQWPLQSYQVREQVLQQVNGVHSAEMEARGYGLTGRAVALRQYWQTLGASIVHYRAGTLPPATVSIDTASCPGHGNAPETLLRLADQAPYRAKHLGRNTIASATTLNPW